MAAVAVAGQARSQDTSNTDRKSSSVSEVVVTGERVRRLEQFTPTGSRLNLPAKETPATLDVITADTMMTRGFLNVEQAADSMPGVTSGGDPGDLEDFHIRGFSDTQVTVLHNGIYVGPSDMVNRPQNTFNVQSVEVLKGPASVLYGQGAIGGAINVVNKAPSFGPPAYNIHAALGSFGTTAIGFGGSTKLTDNLAARIDISRTSTNGYVDNTPGNSFDTTLTLLWKPTPQLDVQLLVDYLSDRPSGYWGTPLVTDAFATDPLKGVLSTTYGYTLDSRLRYKNYNVADNSITSNQIWPQLFVKWRPTDSLTIQNFLYYYQSTRKWKDSETYTFDPTTNLMGRDRFFVFHHQKLVGDQLSASFTHDVFGLANQLVLGFDYSHMDFKRRAGGPNGDEVDPFNPSPGLFGSVTPFSINHAVWDDPAVFFEDILSVTDKFKIVTGARYDYLLYDQKFSNPDGSLDTVDSFSQVYKPFTYRVGLVYDLNQYITPYFSYTTGQDPVGSDIFQLSASQNFQLGHSDQFEGGVKASAPDNRASLTVAVYDIRRNNVLTQTSQTAFSDIGSETSHGAEASGDVRVTTDWTINANLAYNEARYGKFAYLDANNNFINASGHQIPNAPRWVGNVWTSYEHIAGLPLEIGGGLHYNGDRMGNTSNTMRLDSYVTLNTYLTYSVTPHVDVSFRVDNLTDKAYAQSASIFYPSQVELGRPRYFQFDVRAHF
jgi:iron complex outermembrane receptor protein